ncbi:peptidoglycan-binding domain-containing protein [Antarctobacter jejuensis]|uniref:peptidoglycan-binding domain-containing protein n=1 Tax=Antarctobacter jejuensis TaxID=1439938 RepID=UPI003FD1CDC8
MRILAAAVIGAVLGTAATAEGDALVIGNSRYSAVQTLFGAQRVASAAQALRAKGFDVTVVQDAGANEMRSAFGQFAEQLDDDGGPVVVVLSGAFVHGSGGAYLLPVSGAGSANEADVLMNGFPLDAALTILAGHQGRAFLVLGEAEAEPDLPRYLSVGVGDLDIPQGVTVVRGPAVDVARYAVRDLARTGRFVLRAALEYELQVDGYAPETQVIVLPEDVTPPRGAVEPPFQDTAAARAADNAAWRLAQQADSAEAYRTYLQGYPQGAHLNAARQRLNALNAEPFYRERRIEEAMELGRDDRRVIQRALTLLGYDTRGIDGIFGAGSRGAIQRWQKDAGLPVTSYLNPLQLKALQQQAAVRAAELEEEDRKNREAREREEADFWRQVSGRGHESGLREYLKRYPEGRFADEAQKALSKIDGTREQKAVGKDKRAWAQARDANTIGAYQAYLGDWPQGAFRAEAEQRIAALQKDSERVRNAVAAREEERAMNLNFVARRLAEQRLQQLDLNPGQIDGTFDEKTRRALRTYQESRGLRVSGYLDEQTVVRLLADGFIGIDR